LFLGPFFFASYGFATWVSGLRVDVGVIVFSWERQIPFLPWTILPYWLIDLLYAISLFLCADRLRLDNHAKRLLAAQVIAVSCFLLFPLRFSFERGPVDGPFGWFFELLGSFDRPFNQAPSLHIALLVLLWVVYLRALPRAWRWPLHGLFALIGASVLTTWQHHFVDVPTGLWLGWFCLWLFPDDTASPLARAAFPPDPIRRRLALVYGLAAMLVALVSIAVGGAALWLLWGAGALAMVAANYLYFGEPGFLKRSDGVMSEAVNWLLAPYMLGAWLNSRIWTHRLRTMSLVRPGVLLGRLPNGSELERGGVKAIVDVTAELPCPSAGRAYSNVPMLDLVPPRSEQIERAVKLVEDYRNGTESGGPVLVCCALGLSRSALVAAAWLLRSSNVDSLENALEEVRRVRAGVALSFAHEAALAEWWAIYGRVRVSAQSESAP